MVIIVSAFVILIALVIAVLSIFGLYPKALLGPFSGVLGRLGFFGCSPQHDSM